MSCAASLLCEAAFGNRKERDRRIEREKERKRTRRGDYRRHGSLCERLSLARQGGGTLWILMNWQDSPKTSSISMAWGRQEGKEEVIRKAQPLYGKPNRAGHFPCDNYGYNQAWGIGNGPAYSSCPAKATTEPVKGKSMMMCFFFVFFLWLVGWLW